MLLLLLLLFVSWIYWISNGWSVFYSRNVIDSRNYRCVVACVFYYHTDSKHNRFLFESVDDSIWQNCPHSNFKTHTWRVWVCVFVYVRCSCFDLPLLELLLLLRCVVFFPNVCACVCVSVCLCGAVYIYDFYDMFTWYFDIFPSDLLTFAICVRRHTIIITVIRSVEIFTRAKLLTKAYTPHTHTQHRSRFLLNEISIRLLS